MSLGRIVALALVVQLVLVTDASAYLDPGTGSFIFQTIIALLVGASFAIKTYWQRIKSLFARKPPEPAEKTLDAEKDEGGRS
jgi:hypothetical protein